MCSYFPVTGCVSQKERGHERMCILRETWHLAGLLKLASS